MQCLNGFSPWLIPPFPFPSSPPPAHLCGTSVLPACSYMSDDTGMALFAHIDAIHLDDALARMETCDGCHCAWRETETRKRNGSIGKRSSYCNRSNRSIVKDNSCCTLLCRWEHKIKHPNKQPVHHVHKIVKNIASLFIAFETLVSCFGSTGGAWKSVWRGGKLFIWGRRGPLWGMWFRP